MSKLPKLNTILDSLPKENVILPLNLSSKQIYSYPPIKTPKLQELNKQIYPIPPGLRGLGSTIKKDNKKKIIKKNNPKYQFNCTFIFIILIIILFLYLMREKKQ